MEKQPLYKKFLSRKFLMCLLWFVILAYCIIKDGDMIESGFARIIAITGATVNIAYILGDYILKVANIKITHKDTTVEISKKERR